LTIVAVNSAQTLQVCGLTGRQWIALTMNSVNTLMTSHNTAGVRVDWPAMDKKAFFNERIEKGEKSKL
jgi:hypothetical protein